MLADIRPLCVGHVLVTPKQHVRAALSTGAQGVLEVGRRVATAMQQITGEAGIYEHGGHPICRPGSCRTGPIHAHLHVLPFAEDISSIWRDEVRQTYATRPLVSARPMEHYLLQELHSGSLDFSNELEASMLPAVVPPHFVRRLLSRAMAERRHAWIPHGAQQHQHEAAVGQTFKLFAEFRLADSECGAATTVRAA
ncbi:hypothetical protein NBH00_18455 [Paraconexibacter antarcticus]|uniref:HIT domain-containing protein n=1 Tax=Paraconexibacter antarcticus TaxID=2949664 RepID=A0ABY5DPD9_9ACTN|nr:hypothetical protein [Paraconexibacter antarcticus]UTI63325.1 hypothetical protein NBH00_18455 [Paraconexibacter antarcticus]